MRGEENREHDGRKSKRAMPFRQKGKHRPQRNQSVGNCIQNSREHTVIEEVETSWSNKTANRAQQAT